MFNSESLQKLINGFKDLNESLVEAQIEKICAYWAMVEETNKFMNLTRILGDDAITHHFLDSAAVLKVIDSAFPNRKNLSIIDIGTGCGVPGVVLGILRPSWNILLLDSLQKRIRFLDSVCKELSLSNITSVHARAEQISADAKYKRKFDVAISRAFSALDKVIDYSFPYLNDTGLGIAMKGPRVLEEQIDFNKSNLSKKVVLNIQEVHVPYLEEKRFLGLFRAKA